MPVRHWQAGVSAVGVGSAAAGARGGGRISDFLGFVAKRLGHVVREDRFNRSSFAEVALSLAAGKGRGGRLAARGQTVGGLHCLRREGESHNLRGFLLGWFE